MFFRNFYILFIAVLLLFACDRKTQKLLKGNDMEAKLQIADNYYNKKKYEKAIPIYEELLTVYKGQKNVEDIYFKYANAHFLNKSYELASFYFRSFYNTYPFSDKAELAAYNEAICYAKTSPRYSLEQIDTEKAIAAFQVFVDKYPKSERVKEANTKMDELRAKLRKKAYEAAYLYYKIGEYKAASVSLRQFLQDYPEYENHEKIDFLISKSLFKYAEGSYKDKKDERLADAQKEYAFFKTTYPASTHLNELEKLSKKN